MDETVGGVHIIIRCSVLHRLTYHADGFPHVVGLAESFTPERTVDGDVLKAQHAHRYGSYLIMSHGKESTVMSHDTHGVAFLHTIVDAFDGTGEYPGVEAQKTALLTFFQSYCLVFHCCQFSL